MPVYGNAVRDSSCRWGRFLGDRGWVRADRLRVCADERRPSCRRGSGRHIGSLPKPNRGALEFSGTQPRAMLGNSAMTQSLRTSGTLASGHGFRSSFKDWARHHDVDEVLSEFALAHVEGSETVAAYARDDLLEKRWPIMQRWADEVAVLVGYCAMVESVSAENRHRAARRWRAHTGLLLGRFQVACSFNLLNKGVKGTRSSVAGIL